MLLDIVIIMFLMGLAIVLILLEIFLLPGITLAGIGGALFAVGGIIFAYSVGQTAGHLTFIASLIVFGAAFTWLLRSKSFSKVALKTNVDSKLTSSRDLGIVVGDEGITLSRLAPIGKARIKDVTTEVKSQGEFVDEKTPVTVVRVDSNIIIVAPGTKKTNSHT